MAKTLPVSPEESIVYCEQKVVRCNGVMLKQNAISESTVKNAIGT